MDSRTYVAFAGSERISRGELEQVVHDTKSFADGGDTRGVLVFDETTGRQLDFDLRGSVREVLARLPQPSRVPEAASAEAGTAESAETPRRGPGRPKLGVVGREVTLLPRHWEWLASQPGGASVALRKLVEQARRASADSDRRRSAQEAEYRFTTAMAGNEPGYEEATRALFAGDSALFASHTESWPEDVRDQAREMASRSFAGLG